MGKYNIIPAPMVQDIKNDETTRILDTLYDRVKNRVMPCVVNASKTIAQDFIDELEEAGYHVEKDSFDANQDQWRIFWDFETYRTVEKKQKDSHLDIFY